MDRKRAKEVIKAIAKKGRQRWKGDKGGDERGN